MTTANFSLRRAAGLTRWNLTLLVRNKLAAFYAVVMPLLPLGLLLTGDRGDPSIGASAISTMLLVAGLFPVYYNVLSQFVNRRDELVLKRMRTGEARDSELLLSIAAPGILSSLLVLAVAVPVAAALGQALPVNPLVYAAMALGAVAMFTAFAYWTAAWTRNAEAAQLTSLPVILVTSAGPLGISIPGMSDTLREILAATPGGSMAELVRVGWFGFDGPEATRTTLSFTDALAQAGPPLLVMAAWIAIAVALAKRSMRWEPRS
jgi:ABC-2 type transport system permease protein